MNQIKDDENLKKRLSFYESFDDCLVCQSKKNLEDLYKELDYQLMFINKSLIGHREQIYYYVLMNFCQKAPEIRHSSHPLHYVILLMRLSKSYHNLQAD